MPIDQHPFRLQKNERDADRLRAIKLGRTDMLMYITYTVPVGILWVDLLQVQNGEHPCITVSPVAMSISFVQLLTSAVLLLIA